MLSALRQAARRAPAQVRAFHSSPASRGVEEYLAKVKTVGQSAAKKTEATVEPAWYWAKVSGELAKQVYQAQALAPPTSLAQIKAAYQTFYHNASNVSWWTTIYANGQWKTLALYGLEAYGFFKVGEIIGRRHLIGYKTDGPAAHH